MKYKKFIAILLTLATLSTPLYAATTISNTAATTATTKVLTLEDAISSALSNSNSLSLNSQQNTVLTEQLRYMDNLSSLAYENLYLTKQQNEQQRTFLKDQIAYDIEKRYNNILLLELELENLKADIAQKKNELKVLKTKKDLGLVTPLQFEGSELEIKSLEANQLAKQETLNSERAAFKILTNRSLDKYTLENMIEFTPFRITTHIEGYFRSKVAEYLKYQQAFADMQANHIFDKFITAPTYAEYLNAKYEANSSALKIEDSTDQLVQGLISSYASLLSLEEQINTLQTQYEFTKKQLNTAKLQYDLGLMTKLDYEKQAASLKDLEYNLLMLINNYNTLAQMLQKPWLMSADTMSAEKNKK